jgi:hypothetical protein
MTVRRLWRAVVLIRLVALVADIGSLLVQAQGPDELDAFKRLVGPFYQAGKYAEATRPNERIGLRYEPFQFVIAK